MERWRDVIGYEGLYQVSNLGRVRSVDRVVPNGRGGTRKLTGMIKHSSPTNVYGHLAVNLHKKGKGRVVHIHRLVMAAFVGPCPEGCEVCHGTNGVADNSVGNLSYDTHRKNNIDKRRDGTNGGRRVVRSDGIKFSSMHEAAEESGCFATNIWAVCNGKGKSAGGYGWKYCDD